MRVTNKNWKLVQTRISPDDYKKLCADAQAESRSVAEYPRLKITGGSSLERRLRHLEELHDLAGKRASR